MTVFNPATAPQWVTDRKIPPIWYDNATPPNVDADGQSTMRIGLMLDREWWEGAIVYRDALDRRHKTKWWPTPGMFWGGIRIPATPG